MRDPVRAAPNLADVAVLAAAVERDDLLSAEERHRRDRRVAAALLAPQPERVTDARLWLEAVCAEDAELAQLRERATAARHAISVILTALGLVLGAGTALAVFYYDGTGRVNVVAVLAMMVLLPLALLIPFLLANLPSRLTSWIPGAKPVSLLFRGLSPGRLGLVVLRGLPPEWRMAWEELAGAMKRHQRLYATVQKWEILRWSQIFGFAWQFAAVGAACALVVFTDLAFGWSTTLTSGAPDRDAQRVHAVTSTLATPWEGFFGAATPSIELIQDSRYYRAVAPSVGPREAARLGGWWPFVIMTMLVYGLLPRALTTTIAERRLRSQAGAAIISVPGLGTILRRVHRIHVQTTATDPERGLDAPAATPAGESDPDRPIGRFTDVVNWAGVPVDETTLSARFGGATVHGAGGASTVDADQALAIELGRRRDEDAEVAIIVKAWEPPMLEFIDFTRSLRRALGPGRGITVLPAALNGASALAPAAPAQLDVWRRKLGQAGDPWLLVAAIEPEEQA